MRATTGAAGYDFTALEDVELHPKSVTLVPTGFYVRLVDSTGERWEMQIRPRSSMALKGVSVANSPATIDSDFRGEVKVMLENKGARSFFIKKGDRIAQAVFAKAYNIGFLKVDELDATTRGVGGFGSTGK